MYKFYLLILLGLLSASAFAQHVTLAERNTPLNKVFDKISSQTGYDFLVSTENLKVAKPVTINVRNEALRSALDKIFAVQPLSFVIQEKMVVVSKKALTPLKVAGRVTDSLGRPLPGATIKIKGGNKITATASDGSFSFDADVGDEIEVSFIGYVRYAFLVNADQALLDIVLQEADARLEEINVVATGYQNLPAERVTGSFARPVKEEFEARVTPDVLSRLSGITSGMLFNANTTASKSGPDISIRGRSTIFANDQPLIVVDNFPYAGDIANINPNDVESVTVLKDAAAASIWGVRAGNGVIVITTKRGRLNQPLRVAFNANLAVTDKPDLNYNPNQLDAASYIGIEQFLFGKGYYDANLNNTTTGPVISPAVLLFAANRAGTMPGTELAAQLNVLRGNNVNDQLNKYFYRNATRQQYALNLSGGSVKSSYFFSAGYDKNLPVARENGNERLTINAQNTFSPFKSLELTAGLNIVQTNSTQDNTLNQLQSRLFPYTRFADENGNHLATPYLYSQRFVQAAAANGFLDWSYVPLNELGASGTRRKVTDIRLTAGLKYTIIKGLSAELKYQYENIDGRNRLYQDQQTYYTRNYINQFSIVSNDKVTGYNVPPGGILNLANSTTQANNARATLNYTHTWADHSVVALAGYELSQTRGENNGAVFYGYNDALATFTNVDPLTGFNTYPAGNATIAGGLGITATLVRLRSSFANLAYTYKDRYTLSGSARIDGSNFFGVATNQKNVPLWSAGLKWDIDKEAFYKVDWLPALSLRASYGYNGNLIRSITGVTTFRYFSNATFTNLNFAQVSNIGNPDLRWEKTGIADFGIDFRTKNNVITGSFDYFFKQGTDLLGFKTFPENSGIRSLQGNYSAMRGSGFDLSVSTNNLRGELGWQTTLLFSHATDKVTHYDVMPLSNQLVGSSGSAVPNVGRPVFGFYGYRFGGLEASTGNPVGFLNGQPSQDYASITNSIPVSDLQYIGPARPTYFGGLNNRFTYKGFSLGIQLSYKLGYYFMAPTISYSQIGSGGNAFLKVNRDYLQRWQKPGDEMRTTIPSLVYPFNPARDQFYQYAAVNVHNAGQVRLQDISLSYDLRKSRLQVFAYADNVALLWKANHAGLDPDAVPGPGDNSTTRAPRSIAIGIKGSF